MIEAVIHALIVIAIVAGVIVLVFYVFASIIEQPIPAKLQKIIWLIFMLLAILWLARAVLPGLGVSLP